MIRNRLARASWLGLVLAITSGGPLGMVAGCGPLGGDSVATVKDPPPLPPEETTEALMKQQGKASSRPAARPLQRR
jgi:hypothetical protein